MSIRGGSREKRNPVTRRLLSGMTIEISDATSNFFSYIQLHFCRELEREDTEILVDKISIFVKPLSFCVIFFLRKTKPSIWRNAKF